MPTNPSSPELHPHAPERRIDGPFVTFDLPFELARLRSEHAYDLEGHAGRTLTKYPDLRVVLEAMKPSVRMPLHETAERMTLQVVLGQIRVWLEHGRSWELAEGTFTAIDSSRVHELECLHECAFLLTLAWPPARSGSRDTDPVEM
jgi:quercetin dioxygenase-like cupin family protein